MCVVLYIQTHTAQKRLQNYMYWYRAKNCWCQQSWYLFHCPLEALLKHFWNGLLYKNKIQHAAIVWVDTARARLLLYRPDKRMLQQSWCQMMRAGMRGLTIWIEYKSLRFSAGRIGVIGCAKQQQFLSLWSHTVFLTSTEATRGNVEWGSTPMFLAVFLFSGLLEVHSQFLITVLISWA